MPRGTFYGVGVGPGDPELLTLKAVKVLQAAEVVVAPQAGRGKESLAYDIARQHLHGGCRLLKLDFPMTRNKELLEKSWEQASARIERFLQRGETVVFLTLGDPMLYSTYIVLFKRLSARGYAVQTVPGVPSFCAAAAAAGFPLGEGEEKLAIVPWSGCRGKPLAAFLQGFDSAVIMKAAGELSPILKELGEAGFLQNAVLVSKCGHPDERIERELSALSRTRAPYFSLILARGKEVSRA